MCVKTHWGRSPSFFSLFFFLKLWNSEKSRKFFFGGLHFVDKSKDWIGSSFRRTRPHAHTHLCLLFPPVLMCTWHWLRKRERERELVCACGWMCVSEIDLVWHDSGRNLCYNENFPFVVGFFLGRIHFSFQRLVNEANFHSCAEFMASVNGRAKQLLYHFK